MVLLFSCAAADEHETEDKVAPLFQSNDLLEVRIAAPLDEIMRIRSREDELPGTITYRDDSGDDVTVNIGVRTRGKYRHQKDVCPFAPLRLNFKKPKGTVFARSDKLKLVTHCRNTVNRYKQALLREYLAYRIFNMLTDESFRVRLLKVRYIDSPTGEFVEDSYAFLIEHRSQLAKRIGLEYNPTEKTRVAEIAPAHTNLGSVFQYMVGNTDFSPIKGADGEACCHNYMLFGMEPGATLAIPYDFDMTGIVSAPYASHNPAFRLRNIRQRLYRGRCVNNDYLPQTRQVFKENRQAIYDLLDELPEFSALSAKKTTAYIDDFYEIIDSDKEFERRLTEKCL